MKKFLKTLGQSVAEIYTGKNLLWQLASWALTYVLSASGFDWFYFEATRGPALQAVLWPAAVIGFMVPVLLPAAVLLVGLFERSRKILFVGYALTESALLGLAISSFYKVFTGRPGPYGLAAMANPTDISRVFRFGIYRGGAFQGWPSSHTAVAFAMSFAVMAMFPKNKPLRIIALAYAFYIGIGVSTNIHWFSDFVAGAVLGALIGRAVGRAWMRS